MGTPPLNETSINPKLYVRYVDDIFAVFDKHSSSETFLDHLNKQHKNMRFTLEKSTNSLPFLDTEIEIIDDRFESWVYRKATNTNVMLNANAVCPLSWKKGLLFGALHRAKMICSNQDLFMSEIKKLKEIFWKNGYSESFFTQIYQSFEQKQSVSNVDVNSEADFKYIFKIPFLGGVSHKFKDKITSLFFNDLRININPIFTTFKVQNYFVLKSRTPRLLASNVVYKFSCLCDTNITYIGKTKRHLMVRCLEHLEFEKKKPESEVKVHLNDCDICKNANYENFEILKKCKTDLETKVYEAFAINKEQPKLNKNLFNKGSLFTLKVYA